MFEVPVDPPVSSAPSAVPVGTGLLNEAPGDDRESLTLRAITYDARGLRHDREKESLDVERESSCLPLLGRLSSLRVCLC